MFFCSSKIMPGGVVAFFHTSKKKHSSWRAPKSKLHISSMGERQDWDTRKVAWGFLLVSASIITMPVAVCNHAMRFACCTRHSTLHGLNSWSSLFLTLSLVAASILHGFGFLSFDFMIFLMIAPYSSSLWGPSAICHVKLKLRLLKCFPASQLDQGPDLIIWYCWWFRNPASQLICSFSHYLHGLYIPGGAEFLPSTVSPKKWTCFLKRDQFKIGPKVCLPSIIFQGTIPSLSGGGSSLPTTRWAAPILVTNITPKQMAWNI